MAQLPLEQASWAIYVPKKYIFFAIFCAGFSPCFFLNIKLFFWDIGGHSQPDFGEMTEVVLSQQRSRRFKTQF